MGTITTQLSSPSFHEPPVQERQSIGALKSRWCSVRFAQQSSLTGIGAEQSTQKAENTQEHTNMLNPPTFPIALDALVISDAHTYAKRERSDLSFYVAHFDELPAIILRHDSLEVLDGYHRIAAARLLGRVTIRAQHQACKCCAESSSEAEAKTPKCCVDSVRVLAHTLAHALQVIDMAADTPYATQKGNLTFGMRACAVFDSKVSIVTPFARV